MYHAEAAVRWQAFCNSNLYQKHACALSTAAFRLLAVRAWCRCQSRCSVFIRVLGASLISWLVCGDPQQRPCQARWSKATLAVPATGFVAQRAWCDYYWGGFCMGVALTFQCGSCSCEIQLHRLDETETRFIACPVPLSCQHACCQASFWMYKNFRRQRRTQATLRPDNKPPATSGESDHLQLIVRGQLSVYRRSNCEYPRIWWRCAAISERTELVRTKFDQWLSFVS